MQTKSSLYHDVPIIVGGPHPSVAHEDLDFESAKQKSVDLVVRGEGEETWIEISERIEAFSGIRKTPRRPL